MAFARGVCNRAACGKKIPKKRLFNAKVRGKEAHFCSDRCAILEAKAAFRQRSREAAYEAREPVGSGAAIAPPAAGEPTLHDG